MKIAAAIVLVAAVVVAGFYAFIRSDSTSCYTAFDSRDAADRAAALARAAGFEADVEPAAGEARPPRHPASGGGRGIFVVFNDGETGDDAAAFREASRHIADGEGALGQPTVRCDERSLSD